MTPTAWGVGLVGLGVLGLTSPLLGGIAAACVALAVAASMGGWLRGREALGAVVSLIPAGVVAMAGGPVDGIVGGLVLGLGSAAAARGAARAVVLYAALGVVVAGQPLGAVAWAALAPFALGGTWSTSLATALLSVSVWAVWPRPAAAPVVVPSLGTTSTLDPLRPPAGAEAGVVRMMVSSQPPLLGPIYLRGTVLGTLDGEVWTAPTDVWAQGGDGLDLGHRFDVRLQEPGRTLFTVGATTALGVPTAVFRDGEMGRVVMEPVTSYQFSSWTAGEPGDVVDTTPPTSHHLAVSPDLAPAFRTWAQAAVARGGRPVDGLSDALGDGFAWTLAPRADGPTDLAHFVTESRIGHCVWFASALAVGLRLHGVPARVATGYRTEASADGTWVVKAGDAHAWVEWYDASRGWVTADATPTVAAASGVPTRLRLGVAGAGAAGVVATLVVVAWRLRPKRRPRVRGPAAEWVGLRDSLQAAGWAIPPTLPPVSAARWVAARTEDGDAAAALVAVAEAYSAARWGPGPPDGFAATLEGRLAAARRLIGPMGAH